MERRSQIIQNTLEGYEDEISRIEVIFSSSSEMHDTIRLTRLGSRYEELKEEIQCLWDEWEKLSLKSESIVEQVNALELDSNHD